MISVAHTNEDDDDSYDGERVVSTPSNPKRQFESDYIIHSWDMARSGFPALLSCVCLIVTATAHILQTTQHVLNGISRGN